jgi:hypothetical protein
LSIPRIKLNISPSKVHHLIQITNNILTLVENPTGIESKKILHKGTLTLARASDSKLTKDYWAELREGGSLQLYESQYWKPLVNVNVVKNGVLIFDQSTDYGSKHKDHTPGEEGTLAEDEFAISLPRINAAPHYFVFKSEDNKGWCSALHESVITHHQYDMESPLKQVVVKEEQPLNEDVTEERKKTILIATFDLKEFFVHLSRKSTVKASEVALAEIRLTNFKGKYVARRFDMSLDASLQSFAVSDISISGKKKDLLSSEDKGARTSKNLAEIGFKQISDRRSEYYQLGGDMLVDLKLRMLHFFFEPVFLSLVVKLIYDLGDIAEKLSARTKFFAAEKRTEYIGAEPLKRDKIQLFVRLQKVDLFLVDYGSIFAELSMGGTEVKLSMFPDGMLVKGKISDIQAKHLAEDTMYKEILGLGQSSHSLIEFTYEQSGKKEGDVFYDKTFTAKMESVKFVYLARTIHKMQVYFTSGPLMNALTEGSKKAAAYSLEAVKKQTTQTNALLKLNITCTNPIIIVPTSHLSPDKVIGNLGEINVSNYIEMIRPKCFVENYRIQMGKMNLKTLYSHQTSSVVETMDLDLNVKRIVTFEGKRDVPDVSVVLSVPEVSMNLSHAQYQMIFQILDNNLGDGKKKEEEKKQEDRRSSAKLAKQFIEETRAGSADMTPSQEEGVGVSVDVKFPHLNLTLYRGSGTSYGREDKLAQLNMYELNVKFESQRSGNGNSTKVIIHAVDAHDLRNESESHFKNFIDTRVKLKESDLSQSGAERRDAMIDDFIHVDIDIDSLQDQTLVRVKMGNPRLVFEPGVVMEIKDFFVTRYPKVLEMPKKESLQSFASNSARDDNQQVGDLTITNNTWLGSDLLLSPRRKIYVQKNEKGIVTIDGEGHSIEILDDENEPCIYIAEGMTLRFKNMILKFEGELDNWVHYADDSSELIAPATDGVMHEKLRSEENLASPVVTEEAQEAQLEKQVEEITLKKKPNGGLKVECDIGRPSVIFPVDGKNKESRLFVVTLGVDFSMETKTSGSENYRIKIHDLKAYVEHPSAKNVRVAPIIEPFGMILDLETLVSSPDARQIDKKVKAIIDGDIRTRIAYQDVKMINQIVNAFTTQNNPAQPVITDTNEAIELALKGEDEEDEDITSNQVNTDDDEASVMSATSEGEYDDFEEVQDEVPEERPRNRRESRAKLEKVETKEEAPKKQEVGVVKEPDQKVENMDMSGQFDLGDEYEDIVPVTATPSTTPKPPQQETETKDVKYTFEFDSAAKQQISILLVDDVRGYDIPLMEFIIRDMHLLNAFFLQSKKTQIGARLIMYLKANYYNMKVADWEPIIELFGLSLDYERKPTQHPRATVPYMDKILISDISVDILEDFGLHDHGTLDINVSQSMVATILTTSKLWREEFSGKSISAQFDPYTLRNHCGFEINLVIHDDLENVERRSEYDKHHKVPVGADFGFTPPEKRFSMELSTVRLRNDRSMWSMAFPVTIDIPSMGKKAIINARKTGRIVIENDKGQVAIIEIELTEGRRIITVRSGVKLSNKSTIPWLIGCVLESDSVHQFGNLKPNETCGVPIDYIRKGTLVIRPANEERQFYQWSVPERGFSFVELMKTPNASRIVTCPNKNEKESSKAFYAVLKPVYEYKIDAKTRQEYVQTTPHLFQRFSCVIEIRPPLAIENLMGCRMTYELFDKRAMSANAAKMQLCKGELNRGEKRYIYTTNLKNYILLKAVPANPIPEWDSKSLALIYSKDRENALSNQLVINDKSNRELKLFFDYAENAGVAYREVAMYCPFWMINRTIKQIVIKDTSGNEAAGQYEQLEEPIMFSFKDQNKKIRIQVEQSQLSTAFTLDNVGVSGNLSCIDDNRRYTIGFYNGLGPGKFKRTKVISFTPRFIIFNRTDHKIGLKQEKSDLVTQIEPQEKLPYYWREKSVENPKLFITLGDQFKWSASPFALDSLGDISVKLVHQEESTSGRPTTHILTVTIQEETGTVFVIIEQPSKPPYLIDNRLNDNIYIAQSGVNKYWLMEGQSKTAYAWDNYNGDQKLLLKLENTSPMNVDINKVTNPKDKDANTPFRIGNRTIFMQVIARGPTRVLRLSEQANVSKDMVRMNTIRMMDPRPSTTLERMDPYANSLSPTSPPSPRAEKRLRTEYLQPQEEETANEHNEEFNFVLGAFLAGVGISLIENKTPKEVAFIYLENLLFRYETTDRNQFIEAKLGRLQIDNQNLNPVFPVLFTNRQKLEVPFLHVSITRSIVNDKKLDLFPYFSVNMQEASLKVDYAFIEEFTELVSELIPAGDDEQKDDAEAVLKNDDALNPNIEPKDASKFYFDKFELHPVKIDVSFRYNSRSEEKEIQSRHNPFKLLLETVGFTLANIDDAPIRLNALILEHPFLTWNALVDRVKKHYIRAATYELYKIIGSLEVIGNPVGLFNDISTGVKDFFYEPAMAITQSPEQFSKSLAKGSKSLISKSLHGTFNTVSTVTGTISKGVAFLTFDREHIKQREKSNVMKPKDFKDGLQQGGEAVVKGFLEGATDLFTQPARGAMNEGAAGLLKGIGKGLIGIPMKPVGGLLEGVTKVTAGISNAQNEQHDRVRFPRTFRADDGAVIPYSVAQAYANDLLNTINEGRFKETDIPIYYMANLEKTHVYMLTDKALMKIKPSSKAIEWRFELRSCEELKRESNGAIIVEFSSLNVFKRPVRVPKKLASDNPKVVEKFYTRLNGCVMKAKNKT